MKSSKAIPRAAKQSRMRSPMRKMHPSPRKGGPPRSPQRSSGSGRPMGPRPRSPSMKRGPPPPSRKHSHSPRRRSLSPRRPAPHRTPGSPVMDRIHHSHKRSHELEKRRHHSRSPLSHRLSPREGPPREGLPTHPPDRYPGSRNREPPQDFDSPPKKKMHRENDRFVPDHSPPRIPLSRAPPRVRSEGHASHNRNEANIHQGTIHPSLPPDHRGRDFGPPRNSDRRDGGSPFHLQDRPREGFCPPSPGIANHRKGGMGNSEHGFPRENIDRFRRGGEPPEEYMETGDKHYGPTLDERFRSFTGDPSRNMESRIQYTREDLEKITIDIRRNIREPSPTVRRILNPSEVKLVRRPSEGNRPIFDREEIKQSPRDMREDAYFEQRVISVANFAGMNQYGVDHRELENYEITRHKFDNYGSLSSAGRSLSDRWQKLEGRKGEPSNLDRDERNHGFEGKSHVPDDFADDARHHRSRSLDRDLRQERFHSVEAPHRRPEYPDFHRPLPNDPADLRHSLAVRRKDSSLQDARQRILERRGSDRDRPPELRGEPRGQWNPIQERRLSESGSDRPRARRSSSRGPRLDSPRWDHDRESDRRSLRDDKLPDFSQRPDRFKYQPWLDKPDIAPKDPSYFEHDDRGEDLEFGHRGSSRPFRGRGFRGRSFRGNIRGGIRSRGSYRGLSSNSSPRGRGYSSRRGRFSPGLWEHDMYEKMSPYNKSDDNRPITM